MNLVTQHTSMSESHKATFLMALYGRKIFKKSLCVLKNKRKHSYEKKKKQSVMTSSVL